MGKTVADRLREATKAARRSIRSVQLELKEKGVPGSSYANVHAYFSGKQQPPVGFLEAAADVLGVYPSWLAFEEGPRDPAEAQLLRREDPSADLRREQWARAVKAWPELGRRFEPYGSDSEAAEIVVSYAAWRPPVDVFAVDDLGAYLVDRAGRFAAAARSMIEALGIEPRDLPSDEFVQFLQQVSAVAKGLALGEYSRLEK